MATNFYINGEIMNNIMLFIKASLLITILKST